MKIEDVAHQILNHSKTKRITITGGEPLEQQRAIIALLTILHREQFDIALYTSYSEPEVPDEVKAKLDYLKTGEYSQILRTTTAIYIGSTNQEFHYLKKAS
jgi:anaerobic ribonucleoside-triphosphate reductase activating protein